jgi:hybrid cluster-associated redox disulfide protein
MAKKQKTKVTKDMNLGEVVFRYPEAADVFMDYGLHCVGCFASAFDTIEMGAQIHMLSDKEVTEMVDRVNEVIEHGE